MIGWLVMDRKYSPEDIFAFGIGTNKNTILIIDLRYFVKSYTINFIFLDILYLTLLL
jgi:hypothetical protein